MIGARRVFAAAGALLTACVALPPSQAHAQAAASAGTSAKRYDLAGRVTGTISPDPDATSSTLTFLATRTTYNAEGRATIQETGKLSAWQAETVEPKNWTGFTQNTRVDIAYDAAGRKIREWVRGRYNGVLTNLSQTQYSYDALGRLVCTAQRMNPALFGTSPADACSLATPGADGPDRITRNLYDAGGHLEVIQRAVGTPRQQEYARYTYTGSDKQASVTDANGTTARFEYDELDRLKRWYFASKTTAGVASTTDYEEYGYDLAGSRTSLRKRDGSVLTYQYDALGRMTAKLVPSRADLASIHTRDVYYGYDLRGLQLYARFNGPSGIGVTQSWDSAGRMTASSSNVDGTLRTLTYTNDRDGQRTATTWPDGFTAQYSYDGLGRTKEVKDTAGDVLRSYGYSDRGLLTSTSFAGGTQGSTTLGYEPTGRVASLAHSFPAPSSNITLGFGYNPASQITTHSRSNDAYVFDDDTDVARSYTVNGLNQYLTAGSASFSYDDNGNLTSDGSDSFVYDIENRLVGASGGHRAELRYDPLGRLYEISGLSEAGTVTSKARFFYDGDELIAEYAGSGAMLHRHVHGHAQGVDDPVVTYEGASTAASARRYLTADHQGSVIASLDAATGLVSVNRYDPWGIPMSTNTGRFQYTGQAWLPEIGLYYYKARLYSPTLGRFLQTDPIGYEDQINLYAYVANDPVNGIDPTGLDSVDCDGGQPNGPNGIYVCSNRKRAKCNETCLNRRLREIELHEFRMRLAEQKAVSPQCAQWSRTGICIQRYDGDGKLHLTEEWKEAVCKSTAKMQDTADSVSDTLGLPPLEAAAAGAGAKAAARGSSHPQRSAGKGAAGGASIPQLLSLISSAVTGKGWSPLGHQVIPKADMSMCLKYK